MFLRDVSIVYPSPEKALVVVLAEPSVELVVVFAPVLELFVDMVVFEV
jgi:hypothetical protein